MNAVVKQSTTPAATSLAVRVVVMTRNFKKPREYKGVTYGQQSAGMYNGGDFPVAINVPVVQGKEYDPGEYVIAPSSFVTNGYGEPTLARNFELLPVGGVEK